MRKIIISALLLAVLCIFFIAYAYSRSLATAGIVMGQMTLTYEFTNFMATGEIFAKDRVFPDTNSFQIQGTNYLCTLRFEDGKFAGAGSLAITTNKNFLWIARDGTAKIIPEGYRPPFFPPKM